jgi:hypothetical protein
MSVKLVEMFAGKDNSFQTLPTWFTLPSAIYLNITVGHDSFPVVFFDILTSSDLCRSEYNSSKPSLLLCCIDVTLVSLFGDTPCPKSACNEESVCASHSWEWGREWSEKE